MITAAVVARHTGAKLFGDADIELTGANQPQFAREGELAFIAKERDTSLITQCAASAVILPASLADAWDGSDERTVLFADEPFASFMQALELIYPTAERPDIGISKRAIIDATAEIGSGTNIHPGAIVAENVTIGKRCTIHPGVTISADCRLGDDVTLWPNVVLYARTEIGDRVSIHAGSVIGADGFGYRQENGHHVKIPHYGRVRIEDDVEIGACSTVDRAMVGETVIGEGSKIDNQVMVAHNCRLGKHNILVSQVGFAGSVTTGDYVVCAGQVGVADHVHIGDGAMIGAKAGVPKDLPGGQRYLGAPADVETDTIKSLMALKKLPELKQTVRSLQKQIAALTEQISSLANDSSSPESTRDAA